MIDLRNDLPRAKWTVATRPSTRFITVHYNGPEIPQNRSNDNWIAHLKFIANFHMGPYLGADGIQYHYAVLPDGTVCFCRHEETALWHCANTYGNSQGLAIHFPLGGSQRPTDAAWSAFSRLAESLIAKYSLPGRRAVYGHRQWPYKVNALPSADSAWQRGQGPCPGNQITALLDRWRAETESYTFTVRSDIDFAAVREGPARWFPIAWSGTCKLPPGEQITCDEITVGENIGGNTSWAHWPAGGFVHMSLFK